MVVLGINYAFHDTSACVVVDGALKVALEEERLVRRKHTKEFPAKAIARCLAMCSLEPKDVDVVAVSIKPSLHLEKKVLHELGKLSTSPWRSRAFGTLPPSRRESRDTGFRQWLNHTWPAGSRRPVVEFVPHHQSHAAGSFLVSPFDSAAVLSIDGSGEWSTSMLGHGQGSQVKVLSESFVPHSLGSFYETVTAFCGFKRNYDEGKTMGLAPFGDAQRFYDKVAPLVAIDGEGRVRIDLSFFDYQHRGRTLYSQKFVDAFGQPNTPGSKVFQPHHEAVAAAFQRVLEERVLEMCNVLHRKTKERNLVIAGGVALNSVMNGRILRESPFEKIYVMPAPGDGGTAIGAAYCAFYKHKPVQRDFVHADPYLGTAYSDSEIKRYLDNGKLTYSHSDAIADEVAQRLRSGRIVGWFQGRMELGARALGGRSILADPTMPGMKDKINAEVKHREPFRPFAPSVPIEDCSRYFDIDVEVPFMSMTCDVLPAQRSSLPAITHVDGSARLQTVSGELNPAYHEMITKFGRLSGAPVVLNTSFNVMDEPIVESPLDAIRCFYSTGLDSLAIGSFIVDKR